jgi:hypothetical protein
MVQEVLQEMDRSPAFLFPENEMADYVFSVLDVGAGWRYPDGYGGPVASGKQTSE